MLRILSTGNAFDIAVTTGDAGQLGMAAEFDGYFSDRMGDLIGGLIGRLVIRLMHPIWGATLSDAHRIDLSTGFALGGDRRWDDRFLGFKLSPQWRWYLTQGDLIGYCVSRRYLRPLSQHSVSQH
ncbi:hypothetical protein C7293_27005 [filamentous cyanobacterium CCT1]|nr:hypothetical protein C7293_27005 [filamentous cyanobacterium CCT1]PSN76485.1 hypothetical protein C8B47_27065 [filamentous cyanobacterium CCP4]